MAARVVADSAAHLRQAARAGALAERVRAAPESSWVQLERRQGEGLQGAWAEASLVRVASLP